MSTTIDSPFIQIKSIKDLPNENEKELYKICYNYVMEEFKNSCTEPAKDEEYEYEINREYEIKIFKNDEEDRDEKIRDEEDEKIRDEEEDEKYDEDDEYDILLKNTPKPKYGTFICNDCNRTFRRDDCWKLHNCVKKHNDRSSSSKIFIKKRPDTPRPSRKLLPKKEILPSKKNAKEILEITQLLNINYRGDVNIPKPRKKMRYIRKPLSEYVKKLIGYRQGWRCFHCTNLLPPCYEVDHNIAVSSGGTNDLSNLRACCRNCHGNKTWLEQIEKEQILNIKCI
jgi:5-methylcytosine-specific restriction endonuclease McrA